MPLAPEGYPFILVPTVAGLFAWAFGYPPLAVICWVVALFCVSFFRDPTRRADSPPGSVLAPADGKVILIGRAPEKIAALGLPQQVSIFMSPANVHVNRAPISGAVRTAEWVAGAKFPAFRDKASELNEHSFVVIDGALGTVAYKQIAGSIARRVVCDIVAGQDVERGQRVGIIKFGSRVDLFLPAHAGVMVKEGQRTLAGITSVADLAVQ